MVKVANPTIVVDVLNHMKRLLRKGWTQGAVARNKSGRKVGRFSKSAVSFCLLGAASRSSVDMCGSGSKRMENKVHRLLWESCGRRGVVRFNEEPGRTNRQILAAVGRALELAKVMAI